MRLAMLWLLSGTVACAVQAQSTAESFKIIDFATFSAEPVDPLWSREMEARILDELAMTTGLALLGLQVECRTTLCRMQSTIRVSEQQDTRPGALFMDRVTALGLVWQQNTTSPVQGHTETSVAYLRRAGTVSTRAFASAADDFAAATIVDVHQRRAIAQDGTGADGDQEIIVDLNGFRYTTHTYENGGSTSYVLSGAAGSRVQARLVTDDHAIELRVPGADKPLKFRIERVDKL